MEQRAAVSVHFDGRHVKTHQQRNAHGPGQKARAVSPGRNFEDQRTRFCAGVEFMYIYYLGMRGKISAREAFLFAFFSPYFTGTRARVPPRHISRGGGALPAWGSRSEEGGGGGGGRRGLGLEHCSPRLVALRAPPPGSAPSRGGRAGRARAFSSGGRGGRGCACVGRGEVRGKAAALPGCAVAHAESIVPSHTEDHGGDDGPL